jgi:RNA polymerase sigma-70 factor (ECF subfamily)
VARNEDEAIRTRATLLGRLKNWNDQASWQEFFDIYWQLIYRVARKAGLTDAEAQDVVQETLVAVAKHMPGFKYDPAVGTFKASWINFANALRWLRLTPATATPRAPRPSNGCPTRKARTGKRSGKRIGKTPFSPPR